MERRAPEQPDFSPDLLTLLDALNQLIREIFLRRVADHGPFSWRYRLLLCLLFAYAFPY